MQAKDCCFVVQSVVFDSWQRCGLQHTRLPCPSPSPGACSNSCPLSRWCQSIILSFVVPFSHCLQSFSIFLMSQLFASGGQRIGASATVLPKNIQDWFPSGLTDLTSCCPRETLKSLLQHHSSKASILCNSAIFMVQLSCPYMTAGKTIALTIWTFVDKVMSLLFNTLPRFGIAFLPRSKCLFSTLFLTLNFSALFLKIHLRKPIHYLKHKYIAMKWEEWSKSIETLFYIKE